jgi:hypothetical protein
VDRKKGKREGGARRWRKPMAGRGGERPEWVSAREVRAKAGVKKGRRERGDDKEEERGDGRG